MTVSAMEDVMKRSFRVVMQDQACAPVMLEQALKTWNAQSMPSTLPFLVSHIARAAGSVTYGLAWQRVVAMRSPGSRTLLIQVQQELACSHQEMLGQGHSKSCRHG